MYTVRVILFSLPERDHGLFSQHYVRDVLPTQSRYKEFDATSQTTALEALLTTKNLSKLKEQALEHEFLTKVFDVLGLKYKSQPGIAGKEIDFAFFTGGEFLENFNNTVGLCEVKKRGRINRHYTIRKDDNSDPIAQIKFYLKEVNALLQNQNAHRTVDFGLLTDGLIWRIYARFHTHNNDEFAAHFIEFRLDDIMEEKDEARRKAGFKLFCFFFGKQAWEGGLLSIYKESEDLAHAVSTGLREQAFTALELLATGLWREIQEPSMRLRDVFKLYYDIDISKLDDPEVRRKSLRIVYNESVVFLLRLLFILYGEDRGLLSEKVIKKSGGILDRIKTCNAPIGLLTKEHKEVDFDFDTQISNFCRSIDKRYNGGIFSDEKHPLLEQMNIDNLLFANAIDCLCRVDVGEHPVVVDFGSISVRELGTLYEGLLEYKFAEADRDELAVESLVDNEHHRFNLQKGDLYLVNHKGERKSSGSYYTPDTIVAYLVNQTVGKRVQAIIEGPGTVQIRYDQLLSLKVCDPAMGSGHFLVEAFDTLLQGFRALGEQEEKEIGDQRMLVARRCLYGVDLNPLAVEIAKMVLWIKSFRPDRPLEFFDANLKWGNSLIGAYKDPTPSSEDQMRLLETENELEEGFMKELSLEVQSVLELPSKSIAEIREKEKRFKSGVIPRLKDIDFIEHLKLVRMLLPEQKRLVEEWYPIVLRKIAGDHQHFYLLWDNNLLKKLWPKESDWKNVMALRDLVVEIGREFRPTHWHAAFPHVFLDGGFDVVLGNPPWDIVKSDHREFFSDYIPGYGAIKETKEAKALSDALLQRDPTIAHLHERYLSGIDRQNTYYGEAYRHQSALDSDGKKLKGDNNLYKLFIEKAHTILKKGGVCGFVVPSGLNSDSGTTGLRRLLLEDAAIDELIMFENRRGIFPKVHRQYKFDIALFRREKPAKNHKMTTGFYWLDPEWLDGEPEGLSPDERKAESSIHDRFTYPLTLTRTLAPDTWSLIEMRSNRDIPIIEKLSAFPLLGDTDAMWGCKTYTEFHMTKDSDLFNNEGLGYPLMEGKCFHQFDSAFEKPTRFVVSNEGEGRLSSRWKCAPHELPNRNYRIGFRAIAAATNERTLIATILPPFVFCGNSVNLLNLPKIGLVAQMGIVCILNSLVVDYLLRFRVSTNVNAFYVKQLPIPRENAMLTSLGELSKPLFSGKDFDALRTKKIKALENKNECDALRAKLDAQIAILYGLTYEELQHVVRQFPLVNEEYKEEVLREFRSRK